MGVNMLHAQLKKIKVTRDGELSRLMDEAATAPLLLEKDGVLFRLHREEKEDIFAGYDAEKVKTALAKTAGSWADIDIDAFIEALYKARESGSRPDDQPNGLSD